MLNRLNIGSKYINVGIINNGARSPLKLKLSDGITHEIVQTSIKQVMLPSTPPTLKISLKGVVDDFFSKSNGGRPNVAKTLMIIFGGEQIAEASLEYAIQERVKGVKVVAISVNSNVTGTDGLAKVLLEDDDLFDTVSFDHQDTVDSIVVSILPGMIISS